MIELRSILAFATCLWLALLGSAAYGAPPVDTDVCPRAMSLDAPAMKAEAVCLLRQYVQIDTTNPPGNEVAAARFVQSFLQREGIAAQIFESAPGRASVYARLHGDGSGKALMLVHHMDVVPADAAEWSVAPFGAELRDGFVWGRGTLDNKGPGIMELLAVVMLKRLEVKLSRDIVLLGVADEEQGGGKGARYMMAEHFDLVKDVEFALNEGGAMIELPDKPMLYAVEFAQKVPLWLRITASGPAGHASMPKHEAAPHVLIRALARLEGYEFPVTVVPEVQRVYSARAAGMAPDKRAAYLDLSKSLGDPTFRDEFLHDPHNAVMVRNSLAITMLAGSPKENVYPAHATAVLDLRLLPGQDPAQVTAELARVMDEPAVKIETLLSSTAHASPLDTTMFKAIDTLVRRHDATARVTASFISGFTDCNTFRSKGITCYGFMPMRLPIAETERVHGRDERLAVDDLTHATLLLNELLHDVATRQARPAPTPGATP